MTTHNEIPPKVRELEIVADKENKGKEDTHEDSTRVDRTRCSSNDRRDC